MVLQVELPDTTCEERMLLWKDALSEERWPEGLDIRTVASKYVLTPGDIRKSAEDAVQETELKGETRVSMEQLFHSCQKQLLHKLGSDAIKITSPYQWDDLILPQDQKKLLKDACDQVAYRDQIYQEWGMKRKVAYGRGTSVIFYGPPGTGKTMGAQVMANQLNLELYKVNMASVMSGMWEIRRKGWNRSLSRERTARAFCFLTKRTCSLESVRRRRMPRINMPMQYGVSAPESGGIRRHSDSCHEFSSEF